MWTKKSNLIRVLCTFCLCITASCENIENIYGYKLDGLMTERIYNWIAFKKMFKFWYIGTSEIFEFEMV